MNKINSYVDVISEQHLPDGGDNTVFNSVFYSMQEKIRVLESKVNELIDAQEGE